MRMDHTGIEYQLDHTAQRSTSVIIRKRPNNCTLVQHTSSGMARLEINDEARSKLIELLAANVIVPAETEHVEVDVPQDAQKRRGRPPKEAK